MLGPGGALRGRPTHSLRLDPLDPIAARVFLPRLEAVPYFEAYAACGGYPLHLRQWDQTAGTDENLLRLAGTAGGILLEDALGILREELPDVEALLETLLQKDPARRYPDATTLASQLRMLLSNVPSETGPGMTMRTDEGEEDTFLADIPSKPG